MNNNAMLKKFIRISIASAIVTVVATAFTTWVANPLYIVLCYRFYDICVYPDNLLVNLIYYALLALTLFLYILALKFIARDRTYIAILASSSLLLEYYIAQLRLFGAVDQNTQLLFSALIGFILLIVHSSLLNVLGHYRSWYAGVVGMALAATYTILIWIQFPIL